MGYTYSWGYQSEYLSRYEMDRIASALTARFGTRIKESDKGNWSTATDGSFIKYPRKYLYGTEDVGKLIHEIAHVHLSEPDPTHDDTEHFLINACDDARINKKILDTYEGAERYIESAVRENVGKKWSTDLTPAQQYGIAIACVGYWTREEIENAMTHDNAKEAFVSTYKAIQTATAHSNSFARMVEIADRDIMPAYKKLLTPKDTERTSRGKKADESAKRSGERETCEAGACGKGGEEEEMGGRYFASERGENHLDSPEKLHARALGYLPRYMRTLSAMKDKMFPRWRGEKERGKIDPRKLHAIATGTGKRVFMQRTAKTTGESNKVFVLVDLSGSMTKEVKETPHTMNDSRLASASANALAFAMACHKTGKNVMMAGFNRNMVTLTNWGERPNAHTMRERVTKSEILSTWGDNCDTAHVERASELLGDGALVIFSDGSPCACGSREHEHDGKVFSSRESCFSSLATLANEIEQAGRVKIYSVGIGGHDVTKYYKRGETTNDDTQVAQALARLYAKLK
jgi:hypothetical protein